MNGYSLRRLLEERIPVLDGAMGTRIQALGLQAGMLTAVFEELKEDCRRGAMRLQAVRQFLRAAGEGDSVLLFDAGGQFLERFGFPRKSVEWHDARPHRRVIDEKANAVMDHLVSVYRDAAGRRLYASD